MSCFWSHTWTKWEKEILQVHEGGALEYQARFCTKCNYKERRMV